MSNSRKLISFDVGSLVSVDDKPYRIIEHVSIDVVRGTNLETGTTRELSVTSLQSIDSKPTINIDIQSITDKDWKTAMEKYDSIKPLLKERVSRKEVDERASELGISFMTLYRWIKQFKIAGSFEGLLPQKKGCSTGTRRLTKEVEKIIDDAIREIYLTPQRESIKNVVRQVKQVCLDKGISNPPHPNTVRARINSIPEYDRLVKRGMKKLAQQKYGAVPGKFPNVEAPLDFVQMDHTKVDIILVDDEHRLPIGRPWVTSSIDLCTRACTGYYLSFDEPSATSDAMCITHSVLKKDKWLAMHDIKDSWPIWGIMKVVHTDNGSDFRSAPFSKACTMHGIELQYRPKHKTHFGGHVERQIKTYMDEIKSVEGSTFSNTAEKGEYDSEKEATMTISEFERWLIKLICLYNKTIHSEIEMSPLRKWEIGVFGDSTKPGYGIPSLPADPHSFMLDFLPFFERTVQRTGIKIDGIRYWSDVLRPFIAYESDETAGKKKKFIFRRDPRNISRIYFYEPEVKQYFEVPYADPHEIEPSIWEFLEAKRRIRADGRKHFNEKDVLDDVKELRKMREESALKTKSARLKAQKQAERAKQKTPVDATITNKKVETVSKDEQDYQPHKLEDHELQGFGDIA